MIRTSLLSLSIPHIQIRALLDCPIAHLLLMSGVCQPRGEDYVMMLSVKHPAFLVASLYMLVDLLAAMYRMKVL